MAKATQVRNHLSGHSDFKVPEPFKGGVCPHCNETVRDYAGVRIGKQTYCSFRHYVAERDRESGRQAS